MKNSIKIMLAGLLAAPVMMLGITTVAPSLANTQVSALTISDGADAAKTSDQAGSLFGTEGIFSKITNTALYLIGAISVLMLIYGGIRYTLSAGDSKAVTDAKNTILYAIIGIIVALLAFAIVNFVLTQLV